MQRQILIVDDHDDLATPLVEVFDKCGYAVKTLESRVEAVSLCQLDEYDLIVIDLDDVDETGKPVTREHLNADGDEIIKAFKICASHFKDKANFNEDELRNMVETVLNYKSNFVDETRAVQHWREKIEFELPSAVSLMTCVLNYLLHRIEKMGVISPEQSNVFVALDEAFVNAVKHGNKYNPNKLVRITAEVSPREARFTVEDEGEGFDITQIPDPLDPANLFKTSGRGVFLMFNIMDEVKYNERGNRIELLKKADSIDN